MRINRAARALSTIGLGITLVFTAASCGGDGGSDTTANVSANEHNEADVSFATNMLQHHAQALSMVDLTLDRALDPEVQRLAEQIRDAQAPEIETFTDWLTDWDEKVPETMRDHENAGHDGTDASKSMEEMDTEMPGMMSTDEMTALQNAPDTEFQTRWLQMMVKHHQGALEMATAQTNDGQYKPAIDLAKSITVSQSEEIDTMNALIG